MKYGSVCSGIEAASVAWEGLGWSPAWFAEIEKFPSAVLTCRWPDVTNLGDMTKIAAEIDRNNVVAPDIMVGGTPCQAFSLAGLRKGLADARGQLTLSYIELANAIDSKRLSRGEDPAVFVWENVPGVLSSSDNAFGCFLAGLAGEHEQFEPGPQPKPGKNSKFWRWNKKSGSHIAKWPKSGCIIGRQRRVAWRILDAQYFGVAQRRRRVFVVASARTDIDPSEILFESNSVRRDTPPSRSSGQEVAGTLKARANSGGWSQDVDMAAGGYMRVVDSAIPYSDVSRTLLAKENSSMSEDLETYILDTTPCTIGAIAAHSFAGGAGGKPEGAGRGTPIIVMAHGQSGAEIKTDDSAPTLTCNHEAPIIVRDLMAFPARMSGTQYAAANEVTPSLMSHNPTAIAYGFQPRIARNGRGDMGDLAHTLNAQSGDTGKGDAAPCVAIAFAENNRGEVRLQEGDGSITGPLTIGGGKPGQGYPAIMSGMAVRRLTPRECERLQGFPDDHTLIPYGHVVRPEKMEADYAKYLMRGGRMSFDDCCRAAADGPRYKALGNSMAVPVMRWIGQRIVAALATETAAPTIAKTRPSVTIPEERYRPFLKWAGGKFKLVDAIAQHMPAGARLIEPFVGAGSIFMNIQYPRYLLNDINDDLINLYRQLDNNPDAVIKTAQQLVTHCTNSAAYAAIRDEFNGRQAHAIRHAALFLALNRTCFNGLIRYSLKKGKFNVGWNKKVKSAFPFDDLMSYAAPRKPGRKFMCGSFQAAISLAGAGDVVFCDPPYEPLPGKGGFTSYAPGGFKFEQQVELANCLVEAHQRGASVLIMNSGAPKMRELYEERGFKAYDIEALRSISSKGETRGHVHDILATLI